MKRYLILLALPFIVAVTQDAVADVVPRVALSQPTGASAELWNPGYNLELKHIIPIEGSYLSWGIRASFHRWTPNAEEMLKVGDRDFRIENRQGWSALGGLSGIIRHGLTGLSGVIESFTVEGGFGLFYFRKAEIDLKGFNTEGDVALDRHIYEAGSSEIVPGISAELIANIGLHVQPTLRLQHVFTSEGLTILTFGVGLLAR